MKHDDFIKNIIISKGEKEYSSDDIFRDKKLYRLIIENQFNLPMGLMEQIMKENGIIHIFIEDNSNKFIVDLKGVSPELYDLFLSTKT
jgi:hypothetical protein